VDIFKLILDAKQSDHTEFESTKNNSNSNNIKKLNNNISNISSKRIHHESSSSYSMSSNIYFNKQHHLNPMFSQSTSSVNAQLNDLWKNFEGIEI
jgi:hypothetical protein